MYQHQLALGIGPLRGRGILKRFSHCLKRLHDIGTARDRAHNRTFFFDHLVGLLLLYFFNPLVHALRGLQSMTNWSLVRRRLNCPRVSLASLSEAGAVFDPEPLRQILIELSDQVPPACLPEEQAMLRTLTAVDGSLLPALPRILWALWQDDKHRAAKLHLHFEVARGIPVDASITHGSGSEIHELRQHLQPGRLYVIDRGFASYGLVHDILKERASFIVRVKENTTFNVAEERPVSAAAKAAGVVRDVIVARLGTSHHKQVIRQPLRIVEVKTNRSPILLLTDQLDMAADLVALAYRYRWTVELFFRWLKCILGCRHWLGESLNALTIQVYVALIASLLLTLWTQQKPTKRTFEMVCFFFSGWATEDELQQHLDKLHHKQQAQAP
jgi:hypothetical protein